MKNSQRLKAFWKSNDGGLIRSMGKWLIAYGIIVCIVSVFWGGYLLLQLMSVVYLESDMIMQVLLVLAYYLLVIGFGIFCIERGIKAKNQRLNPKQMMNLSITIIVLMIIYLFLAFVISGNATGVVVGILDLITFIDAIRYMSRCHAPYLAAYTGKELAKEKVETTSKEIDDEEDEEDLL